MKSKKASGESIFGFDFDKSWDYENGFYLTSSVSRLAKSISHWELYKKIINLPGDIVECGTFKGASLIRLATFREMLESQNSRKIISFDAFGEFPDSKNLDDKKFIKDFVADSGNGISKEDLEICLDRKGIINYELVKGNILETLPKYILENQHLKIAFLHIDVDVYDCTLSVLKNLFDRVVVGGIIVFDDYATVQGATNAIDEFLKSVEDKYVIQKYGHYKVPSYITKI